MPSKFAINKAAQVTGLIFSPLLFGVVPLLFVVIGGKDLETGHKLTIKRRLMWALVVVLCVSPQILVFPYLK